MSMTIATRPEAGAELAMPRLLSDDGEIVACLRRFDGCQTVIGSHSSADVQIPGDPAMAAAHAYISWDAATEVHVLHDCGTPTGTYLNETRLRRPTALDNGARIRIGSTELIYGRRLPVPGYVATLARRVHPMRRAVSPVRQVLG